MLKPAQPAPCHLLMECKPATAALAITHGPTCLDASADPIHSPAGQQRCQHRVPQTLQLQWRRWCRCASTTAAAAATSACRKAGAAEGAAGWGGLWAGGSRKAGQHIQGGERAEQRSEAVVGIQEQLRTLRTKGQSGGCSVDVSAHLTCGGWSGLLEWTRCKLLLRCPTGRPADKHLPPPRSAAHTAWRRPEPPQLPAEQRTGGQAHV